jgi:hypothetical protein
LNDLEHENLLNKIENKEQLRCHRIIIVNFIFIYLNFLINKINDILQIEASKKIDN